MSIYIDGLSFAYGDKRVLDDISLTIRTGECVGIVGVSGGGKSTLLKLLSGLYATQSGIIEVQGIRKPDEIRKNVAMVMQSILLLPTSIKENITCGHNMSEDTIRQACDAAQISAWIASLPEGIETFVGERGGKVSGGQAQRIAIARAIAKNAPVILLDEATSSLDNDTSIAFMLALRSLTKGKTVVSVSHNPGALTDCDRVYRLEGGKLINA
jgi:ABC-type multidrug transport system fused ATPase/permease subunit